MEIRDLSLKSVIEQVGKEKNIDRAVLISALEAAVLSAARKKLGTLVDLEARFNDEAGEVEVYEFRRIVAEVHNAGNEIAFSEAKKLDPGLSEEAIGEDLGIKLDSKEFGRIAAQNAKQIIVQRVREAERSVVYNEYKDRKDEIVTGIVRRFERGNMVVDLGRSEAIVPIKEQVSKENIRAGDRIVAYVVDVLEVSRGSQIILSRTHPNLVVKLFEQEVPEVAEGLVSIEGAAREAGFRTKIAVRSKDADVDPVGACVGMKGSRVQAVVQELRGEKIDIVPFDQDEARFVCNALAPAEVTRVLVNEGEHRMQIVVPDDQLSLAIGRRGQNVRLAAELSGWKIDIQSETKMAEERDLAWASLSQVEGMTDFQIQTLYNYGFRGAAGFLKADEAYLASIPGFDVALVQKLKEGAAKVVAAESAEKGKAHDQSREDARRLKFLSELISKNEEMGEKSPVLLAALAGLSPEMIIKLNEAGFEDVGDVYLTPDAEHLATASHLAAADAEKVRTLSFETLSSLSEGRIQ